MGSRKSSQTLWSQVVAVVKDGLNWNSNGGEGKADGAEGKEGGVDWVCRGAHPLPLTLLDEYLLRPERLDEKTRTRVMLHIQDCDECQINVASYDGHLDLFRARAEHDEVEPRP